jgi:hypothetical protein
VLKIVKEAALDKLDDSQVNDIVVDVFQRRGMALPYSIAFEHRESADSKARIYLEENTLYVIASTEPELRRLVGRFVIRCRWTPHEWFLVHHTALYTLTTLVLLTTLPAISYLLAYLFPEFLVWTATVTLVLIVFFSIWTSNQVSKSSIRFMRDFTIEMADLGCMTEYDSKDYTGDLHLTTLGGTIICVWGALISGLFCMTFYSQEIVFFALPFIVLLLAAMYFLVAPGLTFIGGNLCYQTEELDEGEEEIEVDEFEDNEYLLGAFKDLIERMNLWKSLASKHNAEFNEVRARFSETKYAQCRGVYDYVEEGTLFIDIRDLSQEAAKRFGAAVLATGSLRFYRELSLKRRAIHLLNLLFGLFMLVVALVGAYTISKEFAIGALLFTGVLFIGMWYVGWKQNEEVRRDLPSVLRKTEVFKEYEADFYCDLMFSNSPKFDLAFLMGFLGIILVFGFLILALV